MRARRRFGLVYFLLFSGTSCHYVFIVPYLRELGMSGWQIGQAGALGSLLILASNPIWGQAADGARDKRVPMMLACALAAGFHLLYLMPLGFGGILAMSALMAFTTNAVSPVMDARAVSFLSASTGESGFGRMRVWGSIGFLTGSLGAGLARDFLGPKGFIWAFSLFMGATALTCLRLPRRGEILAHRSFKNIPRVLGQKNFIRFLLPLSLSHLGGAMCFQFFTTHIKDIGFSSGYTGLVFAPAMIIEIWSFRQGDRILKRIGTKGLMTVGILVSALRWTLVSLVSRGWVIVAVNAVHGFAFPFFHMGAVHFVSRQAPGDLKATGQSLVWAWGVGFMGSIASALGGKLYDLWGTRRLFRVGAALMVASAGLLWAVVEEPKKQGKL